MKAVLSAIVFFSVIFLFSLTSVNAQTRQAQCDLCGFCIKDPSLPPEPTPGIWENCRQCLYPNASSTATDGQTLIINTVDDVDIQVTPYPGHYFTQIGCINANIADVTNPAAAGSVVMQILNSLIFPAAGALAFLFILYGAYLLLTSQNDPEKLNQGKKTITGAIIGLIFTLSAVFIIQFIGATVLKLPGFIPIGQRTISAWYHDNDLYPDGPNFNRIDIYIAGRPYLGNDYWNQIEVYYGDNDKIFGTLQNLCTTPPGQIYRGGTWGDPTKPGYIDGSTYRCGGTKTDLKNIISPHTSVKFKLPNITPLSGAVILQ